MASSNSSLIKLPLRVWLQQGATDLLHDYPAGHDRLCKLLSMVPMRLQLNLDAAYLASDGHALIVTEEASSQVNISCTSDSLFRLLDGLDSVGDAARSGALLVQGSSQAIQRAAAAFQCALHAAIRTPTLARLLDRYRTLHNR